MDYEFNAEEIKDAARAARIYCPGFNEDKFVSLTELERRVGDQAYLQAVQDLMRLGEEKGVSCTEALDVCKKLIEQKTKLEREIPELEKRAEELTAEIREAAGEHKQMKEAVAKAGQELTKIKEECATTEKKLESISRKLEKEKLRIAGEIEDWHRTVNVTREEVDTAGKVKAEVDKHGFTLDLILDLCQEFAGYKNAREMLAEGLKKHDSFIKYLDSLTEWGEKERTRIMADIAGIEAQKNGLICESNRLNNVISQLKANIANEEDLIHFYRRYFALSGLIDELTTWDHVYFMRCGNPINAAASVIDKKLGNAHFWMDRPPITCPHCGYQTLFYDTKIYQHLNWRADLPLKLALGE